MPSQTSAVIRFFSFVTLVTFFPSCVAVWNFVPERLMVAEAEEAPTTETAANTRAGDPVAKVLQRMADDELKALTGGPGALARRDETPAQTERRIRVAQAALSLPTATALLASIPKASAKNPAPAEKDKQPEPVKVAQLGGVIRDVRGPLGPQQAVGDLAEADALKSNSDYSGALTAYFDVMDQYEGTNEALWADQGMWDILEGVAGGSIGRQQLAVFEYALASWQPQTVSGLYAAVTYYAERGMSEHRAQHDQVAAQYASQARVYARDLWDSYPDHYLSMSAADYYLDAVRILGIETESAAMDDFATATYALPSCPAKLGGLFTLGKHCNSNAVHDTMGAILAWQFTLAETDQSYIEPLLHNDSVPFWVKGYMCEYFGRANAGLGKYATAKEWYDRGTTLSTRIGPTHYYLAFMSCLMDVQMNPMNLSVPVQSIQDYLNTYPESTMAARALVELGALYMLASDYQGAADIFREVIDREPESKMGLLAEHELNYILEHLYDSVDYAKAQEVQQMGDVKLAKVCGPNALSAMLASMGVPSSVDELATLAKTDDAGTTMLGLVDAAKAKGIDLAGVRANHVRELNLPAIAFVNHNHFVLVTDIDPDAVVVLDGSKGERALTHAEFARMWDGEALVASGASGERMTVAALEETKGGDEDPQAPDDNYTAQQFYVGGPGGAGMAAVDPMAIAAGAGSNVSTSVASPGVNFEVHGFETALDIREVDMSLPCRGPLDMVMGRTYVNEKGYARTYYSGGMGKGWCSSLAVALIIGQLSNPSDSSSYPLSIILQDSTGTYRTYGYSGSEAFGYYLYNRSSTGQTDEKGITIGFKHTSDPNDRTSVVLFPDGKVYNFPTAGASPAGKAMQLSSITDANAANTVTFTYDASVRMTKIQSPQGDSRHLKLSYDGSSRITKVELKESSTVLQTVTYAYNASGYLTKVTDNEGKTTQYAYQSQGGGSNVITKITDKAGVETNLAWYFEDDAGGYWGAYKIEITDAAGLKSVYDRSIASSIDTITPKDGATNLAKMVKTPLAGDTSRTRYDDSYRDASNYDRSSFEYDGDSDLTKSLRPGDVTVGTYAYNDSGRISTLADNDGTTTDFDYASSTSLQPTKTTDPAGLATNMYYDASNRMTKVNPPSLGANGVIMAFDAYGQVTSATNPSSQSSTMAYDNYGRVTSVKDALNNETKYEYDGFGNKTKVTDPRNKATQYYYSSLGCGGCGGSGLLTKVRDPLNNDSVFAYDAAGNQTKATDALGRATDYFYNANNRLTKVESLSGSGAVQTTEYDKQGFVTKSTGFDGRVANFYFDFLGQLTKQSDGVGTYIEYTYYTHGQVSTVKDGAGNTTAYEYDGDLNQTKISYADGKVTKYFYDTAGRQTKVGAGGSGTTDPTEMFYHATTGLMTKTRYTASGGTSDAVYAYNANGQLTKLTDWIDNTDGLRYAYDAAGRLIQLTDYDDSTLTYTYDAAGNVSTMTDYHGSLVSYTYTDRNEVSTITAPGSKVWDYDYSVIGQPTKCSIPNGMTTEYSYDNRNRMTKIEHKDGGSVLDGFTYSLTLSGNITKITHQDNSYWDYSYDLRNRLTKAERKNSGGTLLKRWTYTYSLADNITTKETYDGSTTEIYNYSFTPGNELTKQTLSGTHTDFAYDGWGRMVSKYSGSSSATYNWNYGDKLTKVSSNFSGEGTVDYDYGGDQKRRERDSGGVTTWYNYDAGWNLLNEEDGSDNLSMTYIHDPTRPVGTVMADLAGATPSSGTARYYSQDNIGSTRRLRDSSKGSLGMYEYDPFGSTYTETGVSISAKFTGHRWDDSVDLYWAPHRFYSPAIARWISRDPLGKIDGPNVFIYVSQNPIGAFDPLALADNSVNATARNNPQQFMDLMYKSDNPCISNSTIESLKQGIEKAEAGHLRSIADHWNRYQTYLKDGNAAGMRDMLNHIRKIQSTLSKLRGTAASFWRDLQEGKWEIIRDATEAGGVFAFVYNWFWGDFHPQYEYEEYLE